MTDDRDREQDLQESQDATKPEVDADQRRMSKPSQAEGERDSEPDETSVEEQSEQSFPASDPPSF